MTPKLTLPPISPAAPGPLYAQIVDAITHEVSAGRLAPGDPLPSFRALAEDLMVSLITVKRAYEELERDGILFRKQGLGTFVTENANDTSRAAHRRDVAHLLEEATRAAQHAGMTESEVQALLKQVQRKAKD